jgi:hypothetical protein
LVAGSYATKVSSKAIGLSDEAIYTLSNSLGKQFGDAESAERAVNALYMAKEGGALT